MQKETPKDFIIRFLICIISFDFFILISNHHICVSWHPLLITSIFGTMKTIVTGGYRVMRDDGTCSTVERGLLHRKGTNIFLELLNPCRRI